MTAYRSHQPLRAEEAWGLLAERVIERPPSRRDSMIGPCADACRATLAGSDAAIDLDELLAALAWLGVPQVGDDPAAQLRRLECREYVSLFGRASPRPSAAAVRVWEELVARYDQRIESLAPDLARELGELRATQRH